MGKNNDRQRKSSKKFQKNSVKSMATKKSPKSREKYFIAKLIEIRHVNMNNIGNN